MALRELRLARSQAAARREGWLVPAGLLDGDAGARVGAHLFVDSKAPWDEIADAALRFRAGPEGERLP